MTLLETAIIDLLDAASAPLGAARLLQWVHTHAPTLQFSWEDFTTALCTLQSQGRVLEDRNGYSLRSEGERLLLEQLGI